MVDNYWSGYCYRLHRAFWQISTLSNTFLSLREHAEYEQATRRELDNAKQAAEQQIINLQKQVDSVTSQLRSQLEEKVRELQLQIDTLKSGKAIK